MRDRSLDEFATGAETGDDEREAESESDDEPEPVDADDEGGTDDDSPTSAVEPALSTYEWTPEGAACDRCEAVVEKRWRDGDGTGRALVCADCKEW